MRAAVLAALLAVVALSSCGGGTDEAPNAAPSSVIGLIVSVEGKGSNVQAFTLESGSGVYQIAIAEDVDYGFDLAHLREHLRQRVPVRCTVEERDGRLVALEILDAPAQ